MGTQKDIEVNNLKIQSLEGEWQRTNTQRTERLRHLVEIGVVGDPYLHFGKELEIYDRKLRNICNQIARIEEVNKQIRCGIDPIYRRDVEQEEQKRLQDKYKELVAKMRNDLSGYEFEKLANEFEKLANDSKISQYYSSAANARADDCRKKAEKKFKIMDIESNKERYLAAKSKLTELKVKSKSKDLSTSYLKKIEAEWKSLCEEFKKINYSNALEMAKYCDKKREGIALKVSRWRYIRISTGVVSVLLQILAVAFLLYMLFFTNEIRNLIPTRLNYSNIIYPVFMPIGVFALIVSCIGVIFYRHVTAFIFIIATSLIYAITLVAWMNPGFFALLDIILFTTIFIAPGTIYLKCMSKCMSINTYGVFLKSIFVSLILSLIIGIGGVCGFVALGDYIRSLPL